MGDCTRCIQQFNMNKFAVVVCLAAAVKAEAEADPALLYGAYGYGGYAGVPYAYGALPYAGAYAAGYGVTNGANSASIAGLAPAAVPGVVGGYAGAGRYVANSAGVVHVAKRSAEAEPALLYGAYGYPYAGVYGGYSTYGAYPATYGYAAYGAYPYAYGKRSADAEPEADAEADPALLYGAYGYPYAGVYGGYGAYGAYGAAYGAYPYSYYGKRSADAEADPALLYGSYGYPYAGV